MYKVYRLQYGINVAPTIFHHVMDTLSADLVFETVYLDDILIKSKNREDHTKHLLEVFQKNKK